MIYKIIIKKLGFPHQNRVYEQLQIDNFSFKEETLSKINPSCVVFNRYSYVIFRAIIVNIIFNKEPFKVTACIFLAN